MSVNFSRLQELADDDPALATMLIDMLLAQTPDFFVEMEGAVATQDPAVARSSAHTMKGVCLNLGLDELAALCKQMEEPGLSGDFTTYQRLLGEIKNTYTAQVSELESFKQTL